MNPHNKENGPNYSDLVSEKIVILPVQSSSSRTLASLCLVLFVLVTEGISASTATDSPTVAQAGATQDGPTTPRTPAISDFPNSPTPPTAADSPPTPRSRTTTSIDSTTTDSPIASSCPSTTDSSTTSSVPCTTDSLTTSRDPTIVSYPITSKAPTTTTFDIHSFPTSTDSKGTIKTPTTDSHTISRATTSTDSSTSSNLTSTDSPTPLPYEKASITNSRDEKIKEALDATDALLEGGELKRALKRYEKILTKTPNSPRAQYGKALSYIALAEIERSNPRLEQGIAEMGKLMDWGDVPRDLMFKAARKLTDSASFRGWRRTALDTMQKLSKLFPDDLSTQNEVGLRYLMVGRNEEAKNVFNSVLKRYPNDGYAKVHLGFIMKTVDRNYEGAIPFLQGGIDTKENGTIDGKFFFQLGDAYHRVGKPGEARETYQAGADQKLFPSAYQRSLYNVENIKAQPWWTMEETGNAKHLKTLEKNWKTIRDEGMAQLDHNTGSFEPEAEDLRESGDWKQLMLFQRGQKVINNCKLVPKTCALVEKFTEASRCKRGQVKYSVMQPGVHVWPHCGPTNCRIRAHLGLVVPEGPRIRVAEDTRGWKEGEFIIFDDSFEHEVWHDGNSTRLVLIVDMWHPDLTDRQKQTLPAI